MKTPTEHYPEKTERVVLFLSKELGTAIAAWRRRRMLPNRSEAIRRILIEYFAREREEQKRRT